MIIELSISKRVYNYKINEKPFIVSEEIGSYKDNQNYLISIFAKLNKTTTTLMENKNEILM